MTLFRLQIINFVLICLIIQSQVWVYKFRLHTKTLNTFWVIGCQYAFVWHLKHVPRQFFTFPDEMK